MSLGTNGKIEIAINAHTRPVVDVKKVVINIAGDDCGVDQPIMRVHTEQRGISPLLHRAVARITPMGTVEVTVYGPHPIQTKRK